MCISWFCKICWFPVRKCWSQPNSRDVSRDLYICWVFLRYGIIVPSFIIVGYVWRNCHLWAAQKKPILNRVNHKINKSNKKISTHYGIIYLYSKNVWFNVFIFDKCFNFFRNLFLVKRIEISNIIILHIQSNPMSFNIKVLIRIYYICPILYFR